MMRAHIGSNVNSNCVFESVTNGMNVADLTNQKRLPAPIQTGRWYDIVLEVGYDKVDCYLDGQLLMSYTEPQKLFSIAGRDNKTGDIILKVVNAGATPYETAIQLKDAEPGGQAELFTLRSDSLTSENSFTDPVKYIPVKTMVSGVGADFNLSFPPYSISVLRIPDKKQKK